MKFRSPSTWLALATASWLLTAGPLASAEKGKPGITVDRGKNNDAAENQKAGGLYSAASLRPAFDALCKNLRYRAIRVEVDQSEFPFLVYGVLEGNCDYKAIRDALNAMPGYAYTGCVTLGRRDGSVTVFALNMTPSSEYPRDHGGQRLMERLKQLASTQR